MCIVYSRKKSANGRDYLELRFSLTSTPKTCIKCNTDQMGNGISKKEIIKV